MCLWMDVLVIRICLPPLLLLFCLIIILFALSRSLCAVNKKRERRQTRKSTPVRGSEKNSVHLQRHQNNNPHCFSWFKLNEYECQKLVSFHIVCFSQFTCVCVCVCGSVCAHVTPHFSPCANQDRAIKHFSIACSMLFHSQLTSFSFFLFLSFFVFSAAFCCCCCCVEVMLLLLYFVSQMKANGLRLAHVCMLSMDIIRCCFAFSLRLFRLDVFVSDRLFFYLIIRVFNVACFVCCIHVDTHMHQSIGFTFKFLTMLHYKKKSTCLCIVSIKLFIAYFVFPFQFFPHLASFPFFLSRLLHRFVRSASKE